MSAFMSTNYLKNLMWNTFQKDAFTEIEAAAVECIANTVQNPLEMIDSLTPIVKGGPIEQISKASRYKKYTEEGIYDTIDEMEQSLVEGIEIGIQSAGQTETFAGFKKDFINLKPGEISDLTSTFANGVLFILKGIAMTKLHDIVEKIPDDIDADIIPDPKKIGDAFRVNESLSDMAPVVEVILQEAKNILDLLKKKDILGVADKLIELIGKLKDVKGFDVLAKRIVGKIEPDKVVSIDTAEVDDDHNDHTGDASAALDKSAVVPIDPIGPEQLDDVDPQPYIIFDNNKGASKPDFIVDAQLNPSDLPDKGKRKMSQQQAEPVEKVVSSNTKLLLKSFPWIDGILENASKHGLVIDTFPWTLGENDKTPKLISFYAYEGKSPAFLPDKSFTIDLGVCITPEIKLWGNVHAKGVAPIEQSEFCMKVFSRGKNSPIREDVFDNIFAYGFSGLSEAQIKSMQAVGPAKLVANKAISWITVPHVSPKEPNSKQINKTITDDLIRVAQCILKHLDVFGTQRFKVISCDPENHSYELSSQGVEMNYLFSEKSDSEPYTTIQVHPDLGKDGKPKINKDKKVALSIDHTFYPGEPEPITDPNTDVGEIELLPAVQ